MRRKIKFREHPAVIARRNVAHLEALAGRELPDMRAGLPDLPQKRGPRAEPADGGEAPVVAAVGGLLAVHPKVLCAWRQNSGAASYEAASGRYAPIFFYRVVTGQPVRLPDYLGIMRSGAMLALECKRPTWKAPRDKREYEQAAFLMLVNNSGGIGAFVRSVDDVRKLLA